MKPQRGHGGRGSDDWFVEFTGPFCKKARLNVGDVVLELQLADASAPKELASILAKNKGLRVACSDYLRERGGMRASSFGQGKAETTRERRAAKVVGKLRDTVI